MPGIESVVKEIVGDPSQASVAVAEPNTGIAGHSINATTSGHVKTGGVLSSINIICRHVAVFPQSSVALQVRFMVYSWEHVSEATVTSL